MHTEFFFWRKSVKGSKTVMLAPYSMYFIKIIYILSNILARKFSHINSRQFHHSSHTKQTQINKHAKHATIKCEL